MKSKLQDKQDATFEKLPSTKPGDRVLRIRRKRPGIFHTISHYITRFFKLPASK